MKKEFYSTPYAEVMEIHCGSSCLTGSISAGEMEVNPIERFDIDE